MGQAKAPPNARVSAASVLLDRGWGKAPQEHTGLDGGDIRVTIRLGIRFEYPAQMRLAQNNDVVHTLTPDRSDQPFGKAILPGRG